MYCDGMTQDQLFHLHLSNIQCAKPGVFRDDVGKKLYFAGEMGPKIATRAIGPSDQGFQGGRMSRVVG